MTSMAEVIKSDTSTTAKADGDLNKSAGPRDKAIKAAGDPPMETPKMGGPDELNQYDDMSLNELRGEAKAAGVEIGLDTEKSWLVTLLLKHWAGEDPETIDDDVRPSEAPALTSRGKVPLYELLTLEELRSAAQEAGVHIPKEVERGLLSTEMKAFRTGARPTAAPGKGAAHLDSQASARAKTPDKKG